MKLCLMLLATAVAFTLKGYSNALADTVAPIVKPVPIQKVTVEDQFWSPKIAVWRSVTINDCFDKFDRDGIIANFDHVAHRDVNVTHGGPEWYDGLVYEMIRGAADFLAESPDPKLEARLDNYIAHIATAAAADPDGYLNTYTQLREPNHRWGQNGGNDVQQHDLYNAGCLVDAGVHYYRATGKTSLLAVAVKLANLMCKTMGPAPKQNIIPGHAVGEEAMVGLYQLFNEQPELKARMPVAVNETAYLDLAKFWIDARGHHDGRRNFHAYAQDEIPVLQQTTIEGHAVRAPLMCAGLTAVGLATGEAEYTKAADTLWQDMVTRRMYLTGAVGSFANEEKFGPDYVLPNNCYGETCAAVANGFFDAEIFRANGDTMAIDELERSLYNGALSGVSLAGNTYFYENPLEAGKNRVRWAWHGCPCCPPMFLKMMGALPGYIYATDDAGVYVNLFIGSKLNVEVAKTSLTLVQSTAYPWNGDVKLAINLSTEVAFDLNIRIPSWCKGGRTNGGLYTARNADPKAFTISVNDQPVEFTVVRGFARIHRSWKAGDIVQIHMAMPVQRVTADERVEADRGKVALMRGPIVYCLESIDNSGRVRDLFLPVEASITPREEPGLLNGITALHGTARRTQIGGGDVPAEFTAIPYYANANREPASLIVWLPTSAEHAAQSTIESLARATASHCNATDPLDAMNDGITPKDSADESRSRFTWWDHRGTSEWVQYDLDQPRSITSTSVYWWDETRINRQCRVPQSWRLLYRSLDGSWLPVDGNSAFSTNADGYNKVTFNSVMTGALRIEVRLQPGFSGGVLQWCVNSK